MSTTETPTTTDKPAAAIALPKTRLALEGRTLVRSSNGADGATIARHPLDEISDIVMVVRWSIGAMVMSLVFAVGAAAGKLWIETGLWSWVTCVGLGVLGLLSLLGARGLFLVLTTAGGFVTYHLADDEDDCQGFVNSLRSEWGRGDQSQGE